MVVIVSESALFLCLNTLSQDQRYSAYIRESEEPERSQRCEQRVLRAFESRVGKRCTLVIKGQGNTTGVRSGASGTF